METPTTRRRTMQAVRSKDTAPELVVRRLAHAMGFRFRLHRPDLAGKPDLVFSGRRKIVFVHGCFWHGHDCARGARAPKTNTVYWSAKIERNRARDEANTLALQRDGWDVQTIWECELKDTASLARRLSKFLGGTTHGGHSIAQHS